MKYLPPFESIRRVIEITTIRGDLRVNVSYEDFIAIQRQMIRGTDVAEAWRARTYEDIGHVVKACDVPFSKHYLIHNGCFERCSRFPMQLDEPGSLAQHPDVAESIPQGTVEAAQQHFDRDGYRKGRLPFGM